MSTINNISATTAAQTARTPASELRAAQPLDRVKLDALRAAIQQGRYPLDANKLAERLISVEISAK